jgi:hypothetical protein
MKFGNYFYQVTFKDGKTVRRERVTKAIARAAHDVFAYEMILLNVDSVEYGEMR